MTLWIFFKNSQSNFTTSYWLVNSLFFKVTKRISEWTILTWICPNNFLCMNMKDLYHHEKNIRWAMIIIITCIFRWRVCNFTSYKWFSFYYRYCLTIYHLEDNNYYNSVHMLAWPMPTLSPLFWICNPKWFLMG
jgi:hypothetical protein